MKKEFRSLTKEETNANAKIGWRYSRPSLLIIGWLVLMTVCLCMTFELIGFDWLAFIPILGLFQTIAASETDVNSPLNQTLMDKIRENLDFLNTDKVGVVYLNGAAAFSSSDEVILDSSINWEDRYIVVTGIVFVKGDLATAQGLIPGGADDDDIVMRTGPHANQSGESTFGSLLFYSEDGSSDGLTNPAITGTEYTSNQACKIFVDESTGDLTMRMANASAAFDHYAYNLMVTYSEDQGFYS